MPVSMSCMVPIPGEGHVWRLATEAVNAWRGRCVQLFGSAERAVSEALIKLQAPPVMLPHLLGQKLEALENTLTGLASTSAPATTALAALRAFRRHESMRGELCHGCATITLTQSGQWTVILRNIVFRNGAVTRAVNAYDQAEAAEAAKALGKDVQRFRSALRLLGSADADCVERQHVDV